MTSPQQFDVVMAADLKVPGETAASMTDEIRAQAGAGYRTALVHLDSRLHPRGLGIDHRIRRCIDEGLVTLLLPGDEATASLAILRHPTVFGVSPSVAPTVHADAVLMIANRTAVGPRHATLSLVDATVTEMFGTAPSWLPVDPSARECLEADAGRIDLAPQDWCPVVDLDGLAGAPRTPWSRERIIVGWADESARVGRAEKTKSFGSTSPGDHMALEALPGQVPDSWVVKERGSRTLNEFVADLDFLVCPDDPGTIDTESSTVVAALASGAVVVLDERFSTVFGDAAVYARPETVRSLLSDMGSDEVRFREQVTRGRAHVSRTHGYQVHVDRVRARIGPPRASAAVVSAPRSRRRDRSAARVLFVSSNGAGMGHLTRLLAMATRSSSSIEPLFFSLSQAVPVVASYEYPWEYCPSHGDLDISASEWNPLFAERLADVLRRYGPRAVVFDGTAPYEGFLAAREEFPDILFVWSRRGMWKAGTTTRFVSRGEWFDVVLEPGEIAASADHGPTATMDDALRVGPVTLISAGEMLSRRDARAELAMDPDAPALLISLGAGNINDTASATSCFVDAASSLGEGWRTHVVRAPIARSSVALPAHVSPLTVYPLAKYLRAFDAAVVAAGYNSYHEVVLAGLPAVFVPNLVTATDDQLARATYAQEEGFGVCVPEVSRENARRALAAVTDPAVKTAVTDASQKFADRDGALEAMVLVESALRERGVLT